MSGAIRVCWWIDPTNLSSYYLPRMAIDLLTDEADLPRIDELRYEPGVWTSDETIKHLAFSLMPAFRNPEEVSRLFMDHVTLAVARHTTQTYGAMAAPRPVKGGLAPWQERLAKELIADKSGRGNIAWRDRHSVRTVG